MGLSIGHGIGIPFKKNSFSWSRYWTSHSDYYVDSINGNDSNDGTTAATAWKTVAKVNETNIPAGKRVSFKAGCEWRETLIVPSSGSVGSPITFGYYDSGVYPIINGCDLVGEFSEDIATWQTIATPTFVTAWSATENVNRRNIIPADTGASGTKVRISVKATGGNAIITSMTIGEMTTGAVFDSTPTRITFGGSNSVNIPSNTTIISDEINYTYDSTKRHGLHIFTTQRQYLSFNNDTGQQCYYNDDGGSDDSETLNFLSSGPVGQWPMFDLIEVYCAYPDVYNATEAIVPPSLVYKDGLKQTKGTSKALLNNNEWVASDNVLSYKNIGGVPSEIFEATKRNYALTTNNKANILFDNLIVKYGDYKRFMDNFLENPFNGRSEPTALVDSDRINIWYNPGCYRYSVDGVSFSEEQSIKVDGSAYTMLYCNAFKDGIYYYLTGVNYNSQDGIRLYRSEDKINFTDLGVILPYGGEGQWDVKCFNTFVWEENSIWYMLYDGGGSFKIGLATASTLTGPWTKHASNPVINIAGVGNPEMFRVNNQIIKYNNLYYLTYHTNDRTVNTAIKRAYSSDLVNWTVEGDMNYAGHLIHGVGIDYGDHAFCQFNNKTYLFFTATSQGDLIEGETVLHIDVAVDNRTSAEILALPL